MTIVHIVLFEFSPVCELSDIRDICKRMLDLQSACLHPQSGKPYVLSATGGRDTSPEGHQGGFSHGFVFTFDNDEDRRYYLTEDPAHLAFVKSLEGKVEKVRVVDFTPGVY